MNVDDRPINEITDHFHSFYVEAFNIFALGDDHLPHLICACPNRNFAQALCYLLKIAERSCNLKVVEVDITSHRYLVPKILAEGSLAMVAAVLDEAVWVDGEQVIYEGLALELDTVEYEEFARQFLIEPCTGEDQDHE